MANATAARPLRFVQIGDLHITDPSQQNHRDFLRIVDELNDHARDKIDFVYLPGDIADDGDDRQFALMRRGLDGLQLPWRAIPGDHDFKTRSLVNFYQGLCVPKLPVAEDVNGCACLYLDVVSNGTGGPDFRLGPDQLAWLADRLGAARREDKACVVFMHAYPADLGEEGDHVARLLDDSNAVLVAMGHTHYNEISHDGRTIYAATRSTGQIEEGPVGFAFIAVDGKSVSWRFKPLESSWPFVMVTSPADRRLALSHDDAASLAEVRATAWGLGPLRVELRVDEGPWQSMSPIAGDQFGATLDMTRSCRLDVRVVDANGGTDTDVVEWSALRCPRRTWSGSDTNAIGAWPARHLLGTQLGPNRNGRKW